MLKAWLELLAASGWSVPLGEATWCTTAPDETQHCSVGVGTETVKRALRKVGFKALGVVLTFDNSSESELQARISCAWRAFYKYRDLLCCRPAPISRRCKLLFTLVKTALSWCWGSWNLTGDQLSKLRGAQLSMMRKMVGLRRQGSEPLREYMQRANSKVKQIREQNCVPGWDWLYHRSVYAWGGHVARIGVHDPSRLTSKTLQFRCHQWLTNVSLYNRGNQLHGRCLHVWRWERPLYKYHTNMDWQNVAQNAEYWNAHLDEMASWRCYNR